jgi:DNA-binding Xre family transcriptional regulator
MLDERNITRYAFMQDLGISPGSAYGLSGDSLRIPSGEMMAKICDFYQVQPGDFLEWYEGDA